jgi:hypothetical protein
MFGPQVLTIVTATVNDEMLRCAAYRTTLAEPSAVELAAGLWGTNTTFDSISEWVEVPLSDFFCFPCLFVAVLVFVA